MCVYKYMNTYIYTHIYIVVFVVVVLIFFLVRKKGRRVAGRHNYYKISPLTASGLQSLNKLTLETTYRKILYKGYLTLSWTVMQLAASFWRISVTPLESLSYFSLGSSSLSSSCTRSRENDSHHGIMWNCQRLKTHFLRGTQRWFSQWLSITTTRAKG